MADKRVVSLFRILLGLCAGLGLALILMLMLKQPSLAAGRVGQLFHNPPSVVRAKVPVAQAVSANTIAPNTTADDLTVNGNCTLREAVQAANTDTAVDACPAGSGADVIYMTASTYPLTISGAGEDNNATGDLDISSSMTFLGDHPNGWSAVYGDGSDRVFHITAGGITVTFQSLRVSFGDVIGSGGGIYNESDATIFLNDSWIYQNSATISGGGIYNQGGAFTISNTGIEQNYSALSSSSNGGGIDNRGLMNIVASEVVGNMAWGTGGGIFSGLGTLNIFNTTIRNNASSRATDEMGGGGISASNSVVNIANSTLAFNEAYGSGGAIIAFSEVNLTHVALLDNIADRNQSGVGQGGGVHAAGLSAITLKNSIVAGNEDRSPGAETPDIAIASGGSLASAGYNLIGDQGATTFVPGTGDLVGTSGSPIDPVLVTYTLWEPPYRLQASSPAVEHVPVASCTYISSGTNPLFSHGAVVATDQRGLDRPQGAYCDIGAYEAAAELSLSKEVDSSGPPPGGAVNYTIVVENNDALTGTLGVVSDTLPAELALAGAITLEPPSAGTIGTPPAIVTDLTILPNAAVTITIPAQVGMGVSGGTSITNTAEVTVSETLTPARGSTFLVVSACQVQIEGSSTIYSTVHAAVSAATEGDLIKIAGYCVGTGTQTGFAQVAYLNKQLTLRGGYPLGFGGSPDPVAYPTTLDAARRDRVLYITDTVTLEDLILTGGRIGHTSGGGVYIQTGAVTMTRVTMMDNQTTGSSTNSGGALYNNGQLWVDRGIFSDNTAVGQGGAIRNGDLLTIIGSTFTNNSARDGGAIFNESGGELTLQNSSFDENEADRHGGGINNRGKMMIDSCAISENSAGEGGAIYNGATAQLSVLGTAVLDNISQSEGGGLYLSNGGTLTMTASTLSRNQAGGDGGGIYAFTSDVSSNAIDFVAQNSTLSLNQAGGDGGGIRVEGLGEPLTISLTHVTLVGNQASTGSGGGTQIDGGGGRLFMKNSLLVGNTAAGAAADCGGSGTLTSHGYNLSGTGAGCPTIASDLTTAPAYSFSQVVSPALLYNGGPTPTHALLSGSLARDAVPASGCISTDQRGVSRPQGVGCDIGAYEFQPILFVPILYKPGP